MIASAARPGIAAWPIAPPLADRWAVALHVLRATRRGALIWGVVIGLFVLSTVVAFVTGFPTPQERAQVARSLQSFVILLGPARNAETVPGFTMWRVTLVATVMGAIWGLLTSTARLRGEEDEGRWELILASRLTRRAATVQVLVGLGGSLVLLYGVCALLTVLAGRFPGARFPILGSLLFAAGLSAGAGMFLALGALASQIAATRGQAVRLCAGVLGVSYLVRMVADSRTSLGWLRWLSPLGWVEELRPLRNPQPIALLPVVALIAVCCVAAVLLAERRDLNASLLREGRVRRHETRWVGGALHLAFRLTRAGAAGWVVGTAVMAFATGAVAKSAASILEASPTIGAALGRLGVRRATEGYLGLAFLFVAVVLALLAASQLTAIRDEEAGGRLDNLLVRPVSRAGWLAGRLAVSLGLIVVAGLAAGLAAWLGASSQRVGVPLQALLAAGLNATAPALLVLGAGALVFAVRGSLAAPVAYGIVAWSFLVNLLGTFLKGMDWLRQTSVFTHIELAPSALPDWGAVAALALLGAGAATVGVVGFQRRDVEYA